MTVRRPTGALDEWRALPGETRWADHAAQRDGDDLVVYLQLFRRLRERSGPSTDVLLWKPATTRVAHRYAAGEWAEVVREEREWPPTGLVTVPRRRPGPGRRREPDDAV